MAKGVTELLLKISGDNRDAVKKLNEIDGKMTKTADNMMTAAKTMAAAFVASKIAGFGKDAIDAALRAEEAANKFKVVFGPAVEEAGDYVDEYATRLGMSTGQLTGLMGSIGAVVSGMGTATQDVAGLSVDIATLGADLASFHDKGVEQAIQSITSALTGERESLKTSFGIVVKEADVVRQALIMTGKDSAKELTELDKVMATMALVTIKAELQGAVGDLDRTMDDNAAKVRELGGLWNEFQESIGIQLLPVLAELVPILAEVIPPLAEIAGILVDLFVPAIVDIIETSEPFIDFLRIAADLARDGNEAYRENADGAGFLDETLGDTAGALGNVIEGFDLFEQSKEFYANIWNTLTGAAEDNADAIGVWEQDLSGSFAEVEDASVNNALAFQRWQKDAATSAMQASRDFTGSFAEIDQATVNNQVAFDLWEQELSATLTDAISLFDGAADEIETSIDEMLANITAQVEQNMRFEDAMGTLAARGMDDLVAELQAAGPGAAAAAAQFVADPIAAEIANMALGRITSVQINSMAQRLNAAGVPLASAAGAAALAIGLTWDTSLQKWVTSTDTKARQIGDILHGMDGQNTYSSHTHTIKTINQSVYQNIGGGAVLGYADGGITPGGPVLVGERGPELVDLPAGSQVHSNQESRRMTGSNITVNISGNVVTERDLLEAIRVGLDENAHRNGSTGII